MVPPAPTVPAMVWTFPPVLVVVTVRLGPGPARVIVAGTLIDTAVLASPVTVNCALPVPVSLPFLATPPETVRAPASVGSMITDPLPVSGLTTPPKFRSLFKSFAIETARQTVAVAVPVTLLAVEVAVVVVLTLKDEFDTPELPLSLIGKSMPT